MGEMAFTLSVEQRPADQRLLRAKEPLIRNSYASARFT